MNNTHFQHRWHYTISQWATSYSLRFAIDAITPIRWIQSESIIATTQPQQFGSWCKRATAFSTDVLSAPTDERQSGYSLFHPVMDRHTLLSNLTAHWSTLCPPQQHGVKCVGIMRSGGNNRDRDACDPRRPQTRTGRVALL